MKKSCAFIISFVIIFSLTGCSGGVSPETESSVYEAESSASEAESSVSEAESSVSEAESSVSEAESSISEAESSVSETESSVSEAESSASEAESSASEAESSASEAESSASEAEPVSTESESVSTESGAGSLESEDTISTISGDTYIVKSGDSLWKISQMSGVSISNLLDWNKISNPNQIYVGQVLYLTPQEYETSDSSTDSSADSSAVAEDSKTEEEATEEEEESNEYPYPLAFPELETYSGLTLEEMAENSEYTSDPGSPLYWELRAMRNSSDVILTYGDTEVAVIFGSDSEEGQILFASTDFPYRVYVAATGVFYDAYNDDDADGTIVIVYGDISIYTDLGFISFETPKG